MIEWGGRRDEPTAYEREFAAALDELCPGLDLWLHEDDDGTPWLLVSRDHVTDDAVTGTLRLDVDEAGMRGGWSPAFLNWDYGVRADDARIDTTGPDGMQASSAGVPVAESAAIAARWFAEHAPPVWQVTRGPGRSSPGGGPWPPR